MFENAIERAKNEKVEKNVKVCLELKERTYEEIKQGADEHELNVENICRNIIEINMENDGNSTNLENTKQENINIWVISSKYKDAEQDFTKECLDNNQIRVGWYQKGLTTVSSKDRNNILEKKEAGAKTALKYFFNIMREGDIVIMKEGKSKIHAIVQITSKYDEDAEGFFYRKIKKILVIPHNKSQRIAELYDVFFKKGLNMTALYKKPISKIDFLSFIINSSIETNH